MATHDDKETSAIFQLEFGKSWRVWAWIQRQFTPTSLAAFCSLAVFCFGYIINLKTRVVILETQVIPVIRNESVITTLKANVADHAERIDRLERDYDVAYKESDRPPRKRVR